MSKFNACYFWDDLPSNLHQYRLGTLQHNQRHQIITLDHFTFFRGEKISLGTEGNLCGGEGMKGVRRGRDLTSSFTSLLIPSWCSNCSMVEGWTTGRGATVGG